MSLFQLAPEGHTFVLHSGEESKYKIECDALTYDDWVTLAHMIYRRIPNYTRVVGVPQGGLKLADLLRKPAPIYTKEPTLLIVDDVLTTGGSMQELYNKYQSKYDRIVGAVVFARGVCPDWITPLFQLTIP